MTEAVGGPPVSVSDSSPMTRPKKPTFPTLQLTSSGHIVQCPWFSKAAPATATDASSQPLVSLKNFSIPGNSDDAPPKNAEPQPGFAELAESPKEPEISNQNLSAPLMDPKVEIPTREVVRISLVDDEESDYVEQESVLLELERKEMRDVTKILARYSSKHKFYIKAADPIAAQLEAERRLAANPIRQPVDLILWQNKTIQKMMVRGIRVEFRHTSWIIIEVGYRKSSWGGPYALMLRHSVFSKRSMPADNEITLVSTEKILKGVQNETVLTGDAAEFEYTAKVVEQYYQSHPGTSDQASAPNSAAISSRLRHPNPKPLVDRDPPQPQPQSQHPTARNWRLVTSSESPFYRPEEEQQESPHLQPEEARHHDDSHAGVDNSPVSPHRLRHQHDEDNDNEVSQHHRDRRHSDPAGQHHREKRKHKPYRHHDRERSHRHKNKDKRRHRAKRHYSSPSSPSSSPSSSSSFSESDSEQSDLPGSKRRRTSGSHELDKRTSEVAALAAVGGCSSSSFVQPPPPWFGPALQQGLAPILTKLDQANARLDRLEAQKLNYRACYLQIDSNLPLVALPLIWDVEPNVVGTRPANAVGGAVFFPNSADEIQSLSDRHLDNLATFYGVSFPGTNLSSRRKAFQQFICM